MHTAHLDENERPPLLGKSPNKKDTHKTNKKLDDETSTVQGLLKVFTAECLRHQLKIERGVMDLRRDLTTASS